MSTTASLKTQWTPFDIQWKSAMDWWRSKEDIYQNAIRNVAVAKLTRIYKGTGQGISSSDINHTVFNMYQDWVRAGSPENL